MNASPFFIMLLPSSGVDEGRMIDLGSEFDAPLSVSQQTKASGRPAGPMHGAPLPMQKTGPSVHVSCVRVLRSYGALWCVCACSLAEGAGFND
jgi:hypothetical protein